MWSAALGQPSKYYLQIWCVCSTYQPACDSISFWLSCPVTGLFWHQWVNNRLLTSLLVSFAKWKRIPICFSGYGSQSAPCRKEWTITWDNMSKDNRSWEKELKVCNSSSTSIRQSSRGNFKRWLRLSLGLSHLTVVSLIIWRCLILTVEFSIFTVVLHHNH